MNVILCTTDKKVAWDNIHRKCQDSVRKWQNKNCTNKTNDFRQAKELLARLKTAIYPDSGLQVFVMHV